MVETIVALSRWWVDVLALQSLYAVLVAVLVLGGMRLVRITAPAAVEAAWWLVLARLVVPPGWAAPWSLRRLGEVIAAWIAAGRSAPAAGGDVAVAGVVKVTVGQPAAGLAAWWPALVVVAWLAGVVVIAAVLTVRIARYRRIVRRGQPPVGERLVELGERWRRRLKVRRPVRIVLSEGSLMPFTVGVLKPVIHLPAAAAAAWSDELVEPVLAHELAHVARWDAFRISLANAVRVAFPRRLVVSACRGWWSCRRRSSPMGPSATSRSSGSCPSG